MEILETVALQNASGLGRVQALRLLNRFGRASAILKLDMSSLEQEGLSPETIRDLLSGTATKRAEQLLQKLISIGAKATIITDSDYPKLLKQIPDPPLAIYSIGDLSILNLQPAVAIVGSRKASFYGRHAAEILAFDLAARGITVVSGLARGVDQTAHAAALEAGGKTVAILGSGLDQIYPKENAGLAREIAERGVLITELPLGMPPLSQNFPFRNRIISGVTLGVVVVEAAERSGSLITARMALEQNREVFAVPGQITSPGSFGPNTLIKDGAKLVHSFIDILDELPDYSRRTGIDDLIGHDLEREHFEVFTEEALTENEKKLYSLLDFTAPKHVDELIVKSGLDPASLMSSLTVLELRQQVRQSSGKHYIRVR